MAKKKHSENQKLKREIEVLKSQLKVQVKKDEVVFNIKPHVAAPAVSETESSYRHTLPLQQVKTDLLKTLGYAVFSMGLLFILAFTKIDLTKYFSWVSF